MCMICNDWEKSSKNAAAVMQGAQNLFETKEQLGVEHTKRVVSLLCINIDYHNDNRDGRIIKAIKEFITPAPPPVIDRSQL